MSLVHKAGEIRKRLLLAVNQLNEEQINWRFNSECNSIGNLLVHIRGNIHQRIEAGIRGGQDTRNREAEFEGDVRLTLQEAKNMILESFDLLEKATSELTAENLLTKQQVRGKSVTTYEVLNQCNAHFSEHLGQILYIAKMLLANEYVTTSIPRDR